MRGDIMKYITVLTPSNIEVEYRLAGAGSRLGAFIVDGFVQLLLMALFASLVISVSGGFFWPADILFEIGNVMAVLIIGFFVIFFGYFIILETIWNGQTVGKRVLGLRVIRESGEPVELVHVLIRGFLRSSLDMMFIGIFVILFSKRHKRLGDMAAGTVVISERKVELGTLVIHAWHETPWPHSFPDQTSLSAEELSLAKEFLHKRHCLPDGGERLLKLFHDYFREGENGRV